MSDTMIKIKDADGNRVINQMLGATGYVPYRNAGGYVGFFRMLKTGSSALTCQVLVSGAGRFATNSNGLYFCQIRKSGTTIANLRVDQLVPSAGNNNTPTFGYWDDGTYIYVGLYLDTTTLAPFTATLLGTDPDLASAPQVGTFYNSPTQPTGWTAVTITA